MAGDAMKRLFYTILLSTKTVFCLSRFITQLNRIFLMQHCCIRKLAINVCGDSSSVPRSDKVNEDGEN